MGSAHAPGDLVAGGYRIIGVLGSGGAGTTYEAEQLQTGKRVALKRLAIRDIGEWKTLELFEREAKTLSRLAHPGIPQYFDYLQVESEAGPCFYIAQELAPGRSLLAWVADGWRPGEADVEGVAVALLDILVYLQRQTSPVVHRDVKPQNVMRDESGRIFLVDFGGVQSTTRTATQGGSTVVGTFGYMAPEQFRGQASSATDLYGLGATLLHLLTRRSPAELPQRKLKIDFRPLVSVSPRFAGWLDRLIEPAIEDRFGSAREALAELRMLSTEVTEPPSRPPRRALVTAAVALAGVAAVVFLRTGAAPDAVITPTGVAPGGRTTAAAGTAQAASMASPTGSPGAWFERVRSRCNNLQALQVMAREPPPATPDGAGYGATCLALAGRYEEAQQFVDRQPAGVRAFVAGRVFDVAHPVADSGDDTAAGPMMELVLRYTPDNYMALYHAGISHYWNGHAALAQKRLTRFLELYAQRDYFGNKGREVLARIEKGLAADPTVGHGEPGSP